ncbi:MAG: PilN domain-containing protein, partial [Bacillota bacterium]
MSQQINLFNPIFLKQKKYFSAATMAQALGLILLGCFLFAGYASYQVSMLSKEADSTSAQLVAQQAQLNKANAAFVSRQKNQALENEVATAEAEVKSLQQVFEVLQKGEFGNTKGYAEYMRAFSRQIINGVWLTGFSIYGAGNEIGLQGRALQASSVPAYLNRLKREPILQGKSFATLDMQVPASGQDEKSPLPAYIE